jgi:hypothetical protein
MCEACVMPLRPGNNSQRRLSLQLPLPDISSILSSGAAKGLRSVFISMKNTKKLALCAVTVLFLILSGPAFAHHGNAAYDLENPITLKGTVTEFAWSNPHVQIYFDVKDAKGKVVHWACETVSPGMLSRLGWTKSELKPGDEITITLGPAKSGAPVGFALKIVLANSKVLQLGQGRDTPYTP